MRKRANCSRREFFCITSSAGAAALIRGTGSPVAAQGEPEEVSPSEDLMREHGVLKRIMLVYEECIRRLEAKLSFDPERLSDGAGIIRQFIEGYHEKLEEDPLFPRFERAGKLAELVATLRAQHAAGRRVTDLILRNAGAELATDAKRQTVVFRALRQFNRMYAPHEAREDTVLFPAFRALVSAREYDELGDRFEAREQQLFGENGFEQIVARVAAIEKALGVYDLNQFTPTI
jgi:hemerythrin-like domain-containing protein